MTPVYYDPALRHRIAKMKERLLAAISSAIQAPSGHNTQPWMFRVLSDGVELYADRSRSLPIVDPHDREMVISCGAALHHLQLAMRCDGLATCLRLTPSTDEPDLLARVIVGGPYSASDDEKEMMAAMQKRRTNRHPFSSTSVQASIFDDWYRDAKSEGCWIELIEDDAGKHAVADLVAEGDRLQGSDRAFRRELARWVHANRSASQDGMPGFAHGVGNVASYFGPLILRTFDWGNGQAARDRQLAEGSPLLMVIGTEDETPAAWMNCGQALSKILLRGTSRGLDASYLNQPIEVPRLRQPLMDLLAADGYPQLILRWGHGPEVKATPRRSVQDVLIPSAEF